MATQTAPIEGLFFKDFTNSYIPEILKEIYIDKIYHPFLVGKKDLTIVDVGQNIGLVSYFFKDFAKIVIGLEPSAQHREASTQLVKFNNIKNIKILPYALSNVDGKSRFYHNQNTTMFSLTDVVNSKEEYEDVETITLKSLMKREKIDKVDLLKLDVEGFESQIIASDGFRDVAEKIKVIVGEWHTWGISSPELFANSLKDLGFEFKWLRSTEAHIFICTRK